MFFESARRVSKPPAPEGHEQASVPEGSTGLFRPSHVGDSPFVRQGSLMLSERLCIDPFGSLYRGIALHEEQFKRHMLVRIFSGEFIRSAHIGERMKQAYTPILRLGYRRALGSVFILEDGPVPSMACDYHPGRSLAQVLRKVEEKGCRLNLELSLFILRSLAQGVRLMHESGLPHGILNPHGIWIGYQGTIHILDAPLAQVLKDVMPRTPDAKAALAPYLRPSETDPLRLDFFQLGALLHQMLTLRSLRDSRNPEESWNAARLWDPQGSLRIPNSVSELMGMLLGILRGVSSLDSLLRILDCWLFEGDHPAYPFELACFMQSLFEREWRSEGRALDIERTWDYRPILAREAQERVPVDVEVDDERPQEHPAVRPGTDGRVRRGVMSFGTS